MIRKLEWDDFEDLIGTYYSYYEEFKTDPYLGIVFFRERPSMGHEIEWFSSLYAAIESGDAVAMVVEENGHAVGICDVRRNRPGTEVSHLGVLGIAIGKEHRGHGLGEALLRASIEECRGKFHTILLSVFGFNKKAIHLYEKIGFEKYGSMPNGVFRDNAYHEEINMYLSLAE